MQRICDDHFPAVIYLIRDIRLEFISATFSLSICSHTKLHSCFQIVSSSQRILVNGRTGLLEYHTLNDAIRVFNKFENF